MGSLDLVNLIEKLGYPIAMSILIFYYMSRQGKAYNDIISSTSKDIKDIMIALSTQTAYMISAMLSYRNGDKANGDTLAKQAAYLGDEIEEKYTSKKGKTKSTKGGDHE